MIKICGLLLPELSDHAIALRSKRLEEIISPWLLPGMLAHINSFGSSPNAIRARFSRLLAYLAALNQGGWRGKLGRNSNGYSFFAGSLSPCVFSYTPEAIFFINSQDLTNADRLAIDVEKIQKHKDRDMALFLRKIFPCLAKSLNDINPDQLALLWILYECILKLSAPFPLDLSDSPGNDFRLDAIKTLHFKSANIFFNALKSGDYLIGFVCNKNLPCDFTWLDRDSLF